MHVNPIFLLEFGVFNGSALVWGAYELWSVRKSKRDDSQTASKESEEGPGHPER
jgi:hypothetical protein